MRNPQISIDFSPRRYSDLKLEKKARVIIEKMTANPHFPNPVPSLMVVQQATEQYAASLLKANNGTKEDTAVKKNNRQQLQLLLRELAWHVVMVSDKNAAMLLSSGFEIYRLHLKIGPIPPPTGFSVNYGSQSGRILVRCDVIKGVKIYLFQFTEEPVRKDSIWNQFSSTKHTALIEGIAKDRYYAFRVAGIGTDLSRQFTDCISKMVV